MDVTLTEKEVRDRLIKLAKSFGEKAPRTIVVDRVVEKPRSITRTVRIALVTTADNEALLNSLIRASIDDEMDFYFIGSNINLQSSLEVEYLMFETKIMNIK